MKGHKNRTKYQ